MSYPKTIFCAVNVSTKGERISNFLILQYRYIDLTIASACSVHQFNNLDAVLRIRNVYTGFRIRNFPSQIPDLGSKIIWDVRPGFQIPDLFPIPDPRSGSRIPDHGPRSSTLYRSDPIASSLLNSAFFYFFV